MQKSNFRGEAWAGAMRGVLGAAAVLSLTACASFEFTKPAPVQTQPITVRASGEELSGWSDLPIGVYRVPDSHVIITGHQTGQGAAVLFGLIGVAVAHAANASAGAATVKDLEAQLRIKLDKPLNDAIAQMTGSGEFARQLTQADRPGNRMLLTPALVLSFVSTTDIRPYVVLKASLQAGDRRPLWSTRYIASTGQSRPLAGPGGWLENDGRAMREAVQTNMRLAMRAMASDMANPAPRNDQAMTMLQGNFPFMKQRFQTVGYRLAEDDRYLTFIPKLGDVLVFTGVNVFEKSNIVFRPATKDDPVFKLVEEAAKAPVPASAPAPVQVSARPAAAPQPVNGSLWTGTYRCGAYMLRHQVDNPNGWTAPVTMRVEGTRVTMERGDANYKETLTGSVAADQSVALQGKGAQFRTANQPWTAYVAGNFAGDRFTGGGSLVGMDGVVFRECKLELARAAH